MKLIFVLTLAVLLAGCGIPREVWTGTPECMYIGCETGGLTYYPHERPQDKNVPNEHYEL